MPASAAETFSMTHRQILTILGGLMMGMFLAALDQTVVADGPDRGGDDLHGLSLQAWVTTAYLITSTIATPLYGKLSDIYGRKPLYLISIALFLFGSLLSGTATSMYQLAGYRAVQGLGGGGLMSLAITILGDLLSPRERAKYQAYILAVFGTSSVLGPIIGGFFAGVPSVLGITGWRWIFLVNVPLGVAGFFVIWRVLHLPPLHRVTHRIDWPGALALAGGLVPLLLVAEQGRLWGWGSPRALACYGAGVVGLALFLLAERRAGDDALLPLRLFRNRTFSSSALINTIIGMGMFGGLATLPLYLQITKGMGPTAAGLALLPLTLGIMVTSIVSGQTIGRTGRYRVFPILGTGLLALGALALSQLTASSSLLDVGWRSAIFGMGLGFCFQPLVLAVQNAVPILSPTVENRIDRNTAVPSVPPIWRKNSDDDVATPMSRGGTAFCTASTSGWKQKPRPMPKIADRHPTSTNDDDAVSWESASAPSASSPVPRIGKIRYRPVRPMV